MNRFLRLLFGLLPPCGVKNFLLRLTGAKIGKEVSIGPCLILRVDHIELDRGSRLGTGTIVRDLDCFILGRFSVVAQFNWISASRELADQGAPASFQMGEHSALTSRHYVDASGGVSIGDFSTIAGVRSTFLTHGIDWRESVQQWRPIRIGDRVLIGSNNEVTPGTIVNDFVVTGMGTVLRGECQRESLVLGHSGQVVKTGVSGKYFTRTWGSISPRKI